MMPGRFFMTDDNEKYIKSRVAKGDKEAFSLLFKKYYGKVFRFILSMVRQKAVAEDLSQDIFVKLWAGRRKLSAISSIDNYLFVMARNRTLDYIRAASRRKENVDISEEMLLSIASHDFSKHVDDRSVIELVRLAVGDLPPKRRDIFMMSRFDGLTNDEIASLMGVTRKTVENQLTLAGSQIKKVRN